MLSDPRSARLAVWGTAFLGGRTSLDEATLRIVGPDDAHAVVGLPGSPDPTGLTLALGWLRNAGVTGLRLVLTVPGEPGLAGPAELSAAAVAAGEAVLTDGGPSLGLVPITAGHRVGWQVFPARDHPPVVATCGEAERVLAETLRTTTEELLRLDVAGFGPDVADALDRLRADERLGAGTLPPGYPARAARLLSLADRLSAIAGLASASAGGATSGTAANARATLLRDLDRATRQARVAAYNAVLEPQR